METSLCFLGTECSMEMVTHDWNKKTKRNFEPAF